MMIPENFHFLRPEWFYALLPLALLFWRLRHRHAQKGSWSQVCDAHLLPHLLVQPETNKRLQWLPLLLLALGWFIAIVALAGPAWEKQPQPVFQTSDSRIIVLDLSRSMDSEDIKPSRLTRAKHKVLDILKQSKEGKTGLIVFSNQAYVVSPLTQDAATIAAMIPALGSEIMPRQGSRPELALEKADQLLAHGGAVDGDIILITDGINDAAIDVAKSLQSKGRRISVLAVGTEQGAPIPTEGGGFLKDSQGAIVVPRLDRGALQNLANQGDGVYTELRADDRDITTLLAGSSQQQHLDKSEEMQQTTDTWREEGPWLVLLLLPLAALAFRRGWLGCVILVVAANSLPQPAMAMEWSDLWSRADQQAMQLLKQGKAAEAAEKFKDPAWQGQAYYQAGEYEKAAEIFAQQKSADGHYNYGNALAKLGRYPEAIAAYEQALAINKQHDDARFNLDLVKKLLEQQEESPDNESQSKEEKEEGQDGEQSGQGSDTPQPSSSDEAGQEGQSGESSDQGDEQSSESQGQQNSDDQNSQDNQNSNEQQNSEEELADQSEQLTEGTPQESQEEGETEQQTVPELSEEDQKSIEAERALEHWLQRVPDDPSGLLRRKFSREYQRQQNNQQDTEQAW